MKKTENQEGSGSPSGKWLGGGLGRKPPRLTAGASSRGHLFGLHGGSIPFIMFVLLSLFTLPLVSACLSLSPGPPRPQSVSPRLSHWTERRVQ